MKNKKTLITMALMLAVPNMLQQLVTNLTQMVDNLMVGGLQEHAIAGVTITNQVFFIFTIVLFGVGGTAGIFMPQYKGVGNKKKMTEVFRISLLFSLIAGVLFFLVMKFIPNTVFYLFANNPETHMMAHEYLRYSQFIFLILPISIAIMNGFRFSGFVKLPLYISIVTVAVNIILNYGLIHGNLGMPAMGVEGAALGTLIARILEMIITVGLAIIVKSPVKLHVKSLLDFEKKLLLQYIQKGYGLLFNEFFWALGMQLLIVAYTQRISNYIAAMSISNAFTNMIFIGMSGMSVAISLILGEHLGRGDFEQAKTDAKKLLKLSAFMGITLAAIVLLASTFLLGFYDVSERTISIATYLIIIHVAFSWLYYLNAGFFFILRAGGDTRSVLFMDAGFVWVVVIPAAFLLGRVELFLPIHFLIIQFLELLKLLIATIMFKKNTWLNNLTVTENH